MQSNDTTCSAAEKLRASLLPMKTSWKRFERGTLVRENHTMESTIIYGIAKQRRYWSQTKTYESTNITLVWTRAVKIDPGDDKQDNGARPTRRTEWKSEDKMDVPAISGYKSFRTSELQKGGGGQRRLEGDSAVSRKT